MIVRVVRHPSGRRVYILNRRIHHGLSGLIAITGGLIACWRDRHDAPWLKDTP